MLILSLLIVHFALAAATTILWRHFKDILLLFSAIGFIAVFISMAITFIWPLGVMDNGKYTVSTSYVAVVKIMQFLNTGGDLIGAISLLAFSIKTTQKPN